jgi:hypothetical protein
MSGDEEQEETLDCPDCGSDLTLAWTIPQMAHLPEVRTFRCVDCKALFTDQGNQSQPLIKLGIW